MRRTTLSCALIIGLVGCSAALGVGCGGDDNGSGGDTPDGSAKDAAHDSNGSTDSGKDTSTTQDAGTDSTTEQPDTGTDSGQDSSIPDSGHDSGLDAGQDSSIVDAGHDSSTVDAGQDSSTVDSGQDSSTVDSGQDSSTVDSGQDSSTVDSGQDSGTQDSGTTDAGTDADTDAGTTDAGTTDAGTDSGSADAGTDASDAGGSSFDNPVQIDVSSVLDVNTVATETLTTPSSLTAMDASNFDFMTQSKATQLSPGGLGLPDNAFFAAVANVHPNVQLRWSNANGPNSRVVKDGTAFTFPVPQAVYTEIQIFAVSTEGSTSVDVTVTYDDNSTNGGVTIAVADWFKAVNTGQFRIIEGLDRIQNGTTFVNAKTPGITGFNVTPGTSKAVKQVTITRQSGGYFVFYGATAW
jgi:hypothetical protein